MICKRCGRCCQEEICLLGEMTFESKIPPCPALIWIDSKAACGFIVHGDILRQGLSDYLKYLIGIGMGCDSGFANN